ncbi:hypothetical protein L9F63_015025, partial [Diploptera punctata]
LSALRLINQRKAVLRQLHLPATTLYLDASLANLVKDAMSNPGPWCLARLSTCSLVAKPTTLWRSPSSRFFNYLNSI